MQATTLSFLTAGDSGVAWGLAAAVGSLLDAVPFGQRFSITVIDGGFPENIRKGLKAAAARKHSGNVELRFVPFRWESESRPPMLQGSMLNYARLFVENYIDDAFCFYFDTDTVFLESPASLFEMAREHPDAPVWAVRNYPDSDFQHQIGRQSPELATLCTSGVMIGAIEGSDGTAAAKAEAVLIRDDEAASPNLYFNNGVLLINVAEWRRRGVLRTCLSLTERHQFISHEQDALNLFFRGNWRELPEQWNYQLYERFRIPVGCALIHYSGRNKPWHCGYPSEARRPFRKALESAGWPHWHAPTSFSQWLRNTPLRPWLARARYETRRLFGLPGVARR